MMTAVTDALLDLGRTWSGPHGRSAAAKSFIHGFLRPGEGQIPIMEARDFYRKVLWRALGIEVDGAYGGLYHQLERAGLLIKPHGQIGRRVVDAGWSDVALEVRALAEMDRGTLPWIWRIDNNEETA